MNEAVKNGKVMPGEYLILTFDFSRITRSPKIDEATQFFANGINRSLWSFKLAYGKYLGESFASETSHLTNKDVSDNLTTLVGAVNYTLRDIHEKGDKNHPLFGTKGVCSF